MIKGVCKCKKEFRFKESYGNQEFVSCLECGGIKFIRTKFLGGN